DANWSGLPVRASLNEAADFNGDGRADLCGASITSNILVSTGSGFTTVNGACLLGDRIGKFTGDGPDDILRTTWSGSQTTGWGPPQLKIYQLDVQNTLTAVTTTP